MRVINVGTRQTWIGGSGGVSSDDQLAAGHVTDFSPFFFSWPSCCSATSLPLFVRLSVCFPATGVCEPASPPRGEGIRRPADEEQLLLQEPETREGGRKDPQGVGQTEGSVCGDGNKNSLTSPDNKNNSRFVWLVVKYRGKKWFISQYVSTSLDAENHRSAAESNQVH